MDNSYIFITGASSGLGEATAKLLSKQYNVVLNGRDEDRLNSVSNDCIKNGNKVETFSFDLVRAQEVAEQLTNFLIKKNIEVFCFIHFAGMTEVLPISKTKYSVGLEVMNVNYFSATEIISTLLKKKSNHKALKNVILVSSIISEGGKKYQPHYCASKGAINSLTHALACELAPSVRVNAVSQVSFKTRIVDTVFVDQTEDWNPPTLLAPGDVEDLAKVVRFLVSDDSSYITGQIINVDGGERFPKF